MPKIDSYEAGMLPVDSRVVLVVSQGAPPTQPRAFAPVPNVIGRSQAGALESLTKSQLQPQVVYDYHSFVRRGTVAAQYPEPSTSVPTGSQALAIVSSGEGPTTKQFVKLPTVVGQSETEAVGALTGSGLSPQVIYEYSQTVPAGVVKAQLPDLSTYSRKRAASNVGVWALIAVLALALLLGAWYMFGDEANDGADQVAVPSVVGLSLEDATAEIEAAELEVGLVSESAEPSEYTEPGRVVASDPVAETMVEVGSSVNLTVVAGSSLVSVPSLVGRSESDAVAELGLLGLVPQVQEREDEAERGTVIEQSPVAGTQLPAGAAVRVVVSSGQGAVETTVPTVTGLSRSAAEAALSAVGLSASRTESPSDTVAKGMVITQSPVAGTVVPEGTKVLLVISTGPPTSGESVTLPNVVGDLLEDAAEQLEALGLVVRVYPSGGAGSVVAMSPSSGESVPVGSVVIVTVE